MRKTQDILSEDLHTAANELSQLKKKLFDLSSRNPFVNVVPKKLWSFEKEEDSPLAAKIYDKARFYSREYALETTLNVAVFLKWTHSKTTTGEQQKFYLSPLLYRPCRIIRSRKLTTKYRVETDDETYTINPVLRHFFALEFDIHLPHSTDDINAFLQTFSDGLTEGLQQISTQSDFNETEEWQFIRQKAIGVFNYKKSLLGEDYDRITQAPNSSVVDLLYGQEETELKKKNFISIAALDDSQMEIVSSSSGNHLVIQGPPGTGKSHTIVSLIGNLLAENKKVLFVSEKRSALEVVYNRLKKHQLHYWAAYFNTEKDEKKAFYKHLRKAWEKATDLSASWKNVSYEKLRHSSLFAFYPKKLLEYQQNLNGSTQELIEVLRKSGLSLKDLESKGKVPAFADWKEAQEFLKELESKLLSGKNKQLTDLPFAQLNKAVVLENEPILTLEKRLDKILKNLSRIGHVQKRFELDATFDDLTRLCITASVLSMVNKVQLDLLAPETKAYRSFSRLAKKYELLKNKLAQVEKTNAKWKSKPQPADVNQLIDLIKNRSEPRGILKLLQRRSPLLNKTFENFDPNLSDDARIQMLEGLQHEWRLRGELEEVKLRLKHDLHLIDPDQEIDHIIRLRNRLEKISESDSMQILQDERSTDLIQSLDTLHPLVTEINNLQRFILRDPGDETVPDMIGRYEWLRENLPFLNRWFAEMQSYFKLHPEVQEFLLNNPGKMETLSAKVAYANLLEQTRFEPVFKALSGNQLLDEFRINQSARKQSYRNNSNVIGAHRIEAVRKLEEQLKTPASKLKEDQKTFKKKYRSGRRILLHEIGKKQQHLPVQNLHESSVDLLMELQPLWMMNPLAVSGFLPCESDLFDVVIFDEASQIPLEDAIPAIFRAKQVIVVGDSKQMPPSRFFAAGQESRTILDEAEIAFPSTMLKWHYRSAHPDLIRFSNQAFYENELLCLPPVIADQPIEFNYIKEGIFDKGRNVAEAEKIADRTQKLLISGRDDLAIIAFSKEQEKEIEQQLQKRKVDTNKILLRNLENVQGIERKIVLISIGYAKNPEGVFRHHFGPVNHESGANRLNVLFSRAIEKMIVFASVTSSDFKLSDNRGVQILKEFIGYAEAGTAETLQSEYACGSHREVAQILEEAGCKTDYVSIQNGSAISAFVDTEKKKVLLVDPGMIEGEVQNVFSLLNALSERYKQMKIVLSLDLWKNPQRCKDEIMAFFREE